MTEKNASRRGTGLFQASLGMTVDQLATPAVIVDLPKLKANIARGIAEFSKNGVAVRPHLKTAKCTAVAKMLLAAGARGICVAKVGEAEVMQSAGIKDILVTSPIAHPVTASWLARLASENQFLKVVVDSAEGASHISQALNSEGVAQLNILIDINVGQDRTGAEPGRTAVALAEKISALGNLKLVGCQGYEGHLQHMRDPSAKTEGMRIAMQKLIETSELLRQAGHQIEIVTTGGTGTSHYCNTVPGITEVQPGSFIYMDADYRDALDGDTRFEQSLWVLSTVISKPHAGKLTIDAGWKTLSVDCGFARPFDTDIQYKPAGDEHGFLSGDGISRLSIGDRVGLIPGHIDTTVNMHDVHYVVENNVVVDVWTIEARGRVQ